MSKINKICLITCIAITFLSSALILPAEENNEPARTTGQYESTGNIAVSSTANPITNTPLAENGKTLYVDINHPSCNDATSYSANSQSNPWRTIGRAAWGSTSRNSPNSNEAAKAGDVVLIHQGIYWTTGESPGTRYSVALNPVNHGTPNNPIIFRGIGKVEVRMLANFRGPMIGCQNRNYIIWDNFYIDDYYSGSTSDTGPVVFVGSNGCQLINSEVLGHPGSYYHGYSTFTGNYVGVRLDWGANNTIIRNNIIRRVTGAANEAGIMTYDTDNSIIENNLIYNCGQGIFLKGTHAGFTQNNNIIRYNIFRNGNGVRVLDATNTKIYQNIFIDSHMWAGWSRSENTQIVNNVFYNPTNQYRGWQNRTITNNHFTPQGNELTGVGVYNNIFMNPYEVIYTWGGANPSQQGIDFNRNIYFNYTRFANLEDSYGARSFDQWRSLFGLDTNSLNGADPLFLDPPAGNFRLQHSSPGRALGRDVLNLAGGGTNAIIPAGAYITGNEIIGPAEQQSGLPGDANCDGRLNIMDVAACASHILGDRLLSGGGFNNADMSDNGIIDLLDIEAIIDIILR